MNQETPNTPPHLYKLLITILTIISVITLILYFILWQNFNNLQELATLQNTDNQKRSIEASIKASNAEGSLRELLSRYSMVDSKLNEVINQQQKLNEITQTLSRVHDDDILVDIDAALQLAIQQSHLIGSTQPLLSALRSSEKRLRQYAKPRLLPLRTAILHDIDNIKSLTITDFVVILSKLDDIIELFDKVPMQNQEGSEHHNKLGQSISGSNQTRTWWQSYLDNLLTKLFSLVEISTIETTNSIFIKPDQAYLLRETMKLRFLNIRLYLLSRQYKSGENQLMKLNNLMGEYFNLNNKAGKSILTLMQEIGAELKQAQIPKIDGTMSALQTLYSLH